MSEITNIGGTAAATCIDQGADIGGARGDDAIERHGDFLVAGNASSRSTLAWLALTAAFLLERSAVRSSISCIETKFEAISVLRRASVTSDSFALACWWRDRRAPAAIGWSRSGASISAITLLRLP